MQIWLRWEIAILFILLFEEFSSSLLESWTSIVRIFWLRLRLRVCLNFYLRMVNHLVLWMKGERKSMLVLLLLLILAICYLVIGLSVDATVKEGMIFEDFVFYQGYISTLSGFRLSISRREVFLGQKYQLIHHKIFSWIVIEPNWSSTKLHRTLI